MQAEKAAPAPHLPPRNKEEGGREENNDHQKTEKRKIQRQIVCLQTDKRPGKEREREREREFRRIGFYILEEQSTTIFGRIQNIFGEENCTY
jgi:hypothetical protein